MDRVLAEIISGFQSTRPMRGATNKSWKLSVICCISIHAPHAGRDEGGYRGLAIYFTFQSTRPMRGATHSFVTSLVST